MKYKKIRSVRAVKDYNIMFTLEDGETRIFDVKPYIKGTWYGELKDEKNFNTVHPCGDTVEWADGQDIAPHELHELSVISEGEPN